MEKVRDVSISSIAACAELGWRHDAGFIYPKSNPSSEAEAIPSEQQLAKLTDFVSFLEC